jgi:hypothetical protein
VISIALEEYRVKGIPLGDLMFPTARSPGALSPGAQEAQAAGLSVGWAHKLNAGRLSHQGPDGSSSHYTPARSAARCSACAAISSTATDAARRSASSTWCRSVMTARRLCAGVGLAPPNANR